MRHADVAGRTARPGRFDRLHHRLLGPDTLQHRIGADTVRQLLDALDALVAALRHNVGRTKFARELLPRVVAAHRDDAFGTHLLRREHAEESHGTVTHDNNRRTGFSRSPHRRQTSRCPSRQTVRACWGCGRHWARRESRRVCRRRAARGVAAPVHRRPASCARRRSDTHAGNAGTCCRRRRTIRSRTVRASMTSRRGRPLRRSRSTRAPSAYPPETARRRDRARGPNRRCTSPAD